MPTSHEEPTRVEPTARTRVRRHPERAAYDRATIEAILDEALICHVGLVQDGQPYVIPTIHARAGDSLYFHGSVASRMLDAQRAGVPLCVTATIVDGLVLARSAFAHSMNYRSVVVVGRAREVVDRAEQLRAMERISEHITPGRWADVRKPSEREIRQTRIVRLNLDEASAKIRSGGPKDASGDLELPLWAGVLPLRLTPGTPVADALVAGRMRAPDYVVHHRLSQ